MGLSLIAGTGSPLRLVFKGNQKENWKSLLGQGGLFATFGGKMIDPSCSEGCLFEGAANFLTKGGKKTPLFWGPPKTSRPIYP